MTPDRTDKAPPVVAVVMVNWNGWRDCERAYASLLRSTFADWLLIIVDNASSDGSVDHLRALGERVIVVAHSENAGFSGGCNIGVAQALRRGIRYVFLLNNDALVGEDTLGALLRASATLGDGAALGSVVRFQDSGDLQFFGSRRLSSTGGPEWYKAPRDMPLLETGRIATDFVFGAAFFAPAALFERVGPMDERFFLNFEETDWCYRARRLGIDCFVVTDSVVHHRGSATLGHASGPLQIYFLIRNQLLFFEKHASVPQRLKRAARIVINHLRRERRASRPGRSRLAPDPASVAFLLAIRDYGLRRFGDCPPEVRRLAASA